MIEKDPASSFQSLLVSLSLPTYTLGTLTLPVLLFYENQRWSWIEKHFTDYSSFQFHLLQNPGPDWQPLTTGPVCVLLLHHPATFDKNFIGTVLGSITASFHWWCSLTPDPPFWAMIPPRPLFWGPSVLLTHRSQTLRCSCVLLALAPATALSVLFLVQRDICLFPVQEEVYRLPS